MSYARFEGGTMVEVGPDTEERPAGAAASKEPEAPIAEEWFVGQVKSYAPQQGYGFIECPETFEKFNADVFLHRNQVENGPLKRAMKGDPVRFSVEKNKAGRPQARNVLRYVPGSSWVPPTKTFVGRVKGYSEQKGFGFIACDDTRNIFNSDIFLHKNQFEAGGLEKGCLATFTVEVSGKGRPQARNVSRFVPGSFSEAAANAQAEAAE